jgi:hypothetical protein
MNTSPPESPPIAFLFAYVKKKPRSKAEAMAVPLISMQVRLATAKGVLLSNAVLVTEASRRRHFAATRVFEDAVRRSRERGQPLVIPSIELLLDRTPAVLLVDCLERLRNHEDVIEDATMGRGWLKALTPDRLVGIASQSARRSMAIKLGLSARKGERSPAQDAGMSRANAIRVEKARRSAEELRPLVENLIRTLSHGETLRPSALARALNEAGELSPHGKTWTFNSAKNLLERLENQRKS